MVSVKCYVCGRSFRAKDNSKFLCSDECKKIHEERCLAMELTPRPYIPIKYKRKCVICGKEFYAKIPPQITCSPTCSYKNQAAKAKIWRQKRFQRELEKLEIRRNSLLKDFSIEELNIEVKCRNLELKAEREVTSLERN